MTRRDLVQLTTFLAPRSVDVAASTLRQLARWLTAHADVTVVGGNSPAVLDQRANNRIEPTTDN